MSEATKNSPIAQTDDHRRALRDGDDRVRLVGVDDREREDARAVRSTVSRTAFSKLSPCFQILFDQVGDDFGVGFGNELMIVLAQSLL